MTDQDRPRRSDDDPNARGTPTEGSGGPERAAPEAKAREAGQTPAGSPRDDDLARDAVQRPGLTAASSGRSDPHAGRRWGIPAAAAVGAVIILLLLVFVF